MDIELFREFTKVLAKEFPEAGLHGREKNFVARCIKLIRKANYRAKAMSEALFEYCVRFSPKGRNIRLRVTSQRGLEVVVPKGYDVDKVPGLLERKKHWVRAALQRAETQRKFFEPEPSWRVPVQIKLPAIGFVWHATARETGSPWVAVREAGEGQLLVFGATDKQSACHCEALRKRVIDLAKIRTEDEEKVAEILMLISSWLATGKK